MRRFRSVLLAIGFLVGFGRPVRADDAFLRSGTLSVAVADDFIHQRAEFHYELRTDDGELLRLRFPEPPEGLRTGDRIAVHGRARLGAFDVDEVEPLVEPLGSPRAPFGREAFSAWTVGAKRVLVILVNFTDDSSFNPTTVSNTQNLFFGPSGSVAGYYAEASYGLVSMTGDVVLVT
ncbi:MAG: hypothetical protein PT977_13655, partial [Acidobacteriota bacterium]|nr:hypothetical protein [Acidobacteriota bacterium]